MTVWHPVLLPILYFLFFPEEFEESLWEKEMKYTIEFVIFSWFSWFSWPQTSIHDFHDETPCLKGPWRLKTRWDFFEHQLDSSCNNICVLSLKEPVVSNLRIGTTGYEPIGFPGSRGQYFNNLLIGNSKKASLFHFL